MFSGFGPFGRNPLGGGGLPQDSSSLPQSSSGPGPSKNEPTGQLLAMALLELSNPLRRRTTEELG